MDEDETSVEAIRERHAEVIAEFRGEKPRVERLGMSLAYVRAINDIAWLLDHIESVEEYAHQRDLDHIGQRNELEALRTDNLRRRAEDVYYGRNRRERW